MTEPIDVAEDAGLFWLIGSSENTLPSVSSLMAPTMSSMTSGLAPIAALAFTSAVSCSKTSPKMGAGRTTLAPASLDWTPYVYSC